MNALVYETNKSAQTFGEDAIVPSPAKSGIIILTKKKAPVTVNAMAKTVDPMVERIHAIENFDKETAISRVLECEDRVAETYFELGGALARIRNDSWFDPYPSFDKWVEGETEMRRSKARALIQIYTTLANSGLPWAKVSHLGWTKLRRIAKVLTKDNADHWIEVASKHSRPELVETVKKHVADHADEHPDIATPTHKKTFAFYEDQNAIVEAAIEKAMKDASTDVRSEAVSLICLDYMAGLSLAGRMKTYKQEVVRAAFHEAFPQLGSQVAVGADNDDIAPDDD